jgi:hypothetical protein
MLVRVYGTTASIFIIAKSLPCRTDAIACKQHSIWQSIKSPTTVGVLEAACGSVCPFKITMSQNFRRTPLELHAEQKVLAVPPFFKITY